MINELRKERDDLIFKRNNTNNNFRIPKKRKVSEGESPNAKKIKIANENKIQQKENKVNETKENYNINKKGGEDVYPKRNNNLTKKNTRYDKREIRKSRNDGRRFRRSYSRERRRRSPGRSRSPPRSNLRRDIYDRNRRNYSPEDRSDVKSYDERKNYSEGFKKRDYDHASDTDSIISINSNSSIDNINRNRREIKDGDFKKKNEFKELSNRNEKVPNKEILNMKSNDDVNIKPIKMNNDSEIEEGEISDESDNYQKSKELVTGKIGDENCEANKTTEIDFEELIVENKISVDVTQPKKDMNSEQNYSNPIKNDEIHTIKKIILEEQESYVMHLDNSTKNDTNKIEEQSNVNKENIVQNNEILNKDKSTQIEVNSSMVDNKLSAQEKNKPVEKDADKKYKEKKNKNDKTAIKNLKKSNDETKTETENIENYNSNLSKQNDDKTHKKEIKINKQFKTLPKNQKLKDKQELLFGKESPDSLDKKQLSTLEKMRKHLDDEIKIENERSKPNNSKIKTSDIIGAPNFSFEVATNGSNISKPAIPLDNVPLEETPAPASKPVRRRRCIITIE